jgi:hypothetical protein
MDHSIFNLDYMFRPSGHLQKYHALLAALFDKIGVLGENLFRETIFSFSWFSSFCPE